MAALIQAMLAALIQATLSAMVDQDVAELFESALRLSPQERLKLVTDLLESIEGPEDPAWRAGWSAELDGRAEALEHGEAQHEDWSTVKAELLAELTKSGR